MITKEEYELALKIFEELRKEMVSSQRIRTQIIGFKIAFASATLGLILANFGKVPNLIFLIPAFASVFFDLIIVSYGFGIKRIAQYMQNNIEPVLSGYSQWKNEMWEEYINNQSTKWQYLSFIGNFGFTLVISAPALALSYISSTQMENPSLVVLTIIMMCFFAVFLVFDFACYLMNVRG
jgi:hypothetical protein